MIHHSMVCFKHRGRKFSFYAPNPVSGSAIRHGSLTIWTTTKEISSILPGNDCTLWVPICSREGHRDMATEPENLSPRHTDAAGSHYRSPPRWLIRAILLIESHPSPTVLLRGRGQTEILPPSHSGMASHWTATHYRINRWPPNPSHGATSALLVSFWSRQLPVFYSLWRTPVNDSQPTPAALGAIGVTSQLSN